MELDNRMVINGGSNGPDWDYDEDAETEEEMTKEQELAADVARLESSVSVLQGRINELTDGVRHFLHALDHGYFGSDIKSVDLSDTAFVSSLRTLAAQRWSSPTRRS